MGNFLVNIKTEEFIINKGVQQVDALLSNLFSLALEYVVRKIDKGTLRNKEEQVIKYADDLMCISK